MRVLQYRQGNLGKCTKYNYVHAHLPVPSRCSMSAGVSLTETSTTHSSLQSIRILVATGELKKKSVSLLFPLAFQSFKREYFDSGSWIIWLAEFTRICTGAQQMCYSPCSEHSWALLAKAILDSSSKYVAYKTLREHGAHIRVCGRRGLCRSEFSHS